MPLSGNRPAQHATRGPGPGTAPSVQQRELHRLLGPCRLQRELRQPGSVALMLDGRGFEEAWVPGPLVALDPVVRLCARTYVEAQWTLADVEEIVAARRSAGGSAETGLAVLLSYDLFDADAQDDAGFPRVVALVVDRSLRFTGVGSALLTVRTEAGTSSPDGMEFQQFAERIEATEPSPERRPAARAIGRPRSSLPREKYLRAVNQVKQHIRRGNIYQANLTQRFGLEYQGDPYELFADLAESFPAPQSAYLETPGFALASLSPETFLRMSRSGEMETRPIKGTRPRGSTPDEDRAEAQRLLDSAKDRAELLMIVDLERNDLSRICYPGSVRVRELASLHSYPAVHHLVATVCGQVRQGTDVPAMLEATFPGGSITGAPKLRAMQILRELEPASRNFFTGCLLWFGDDGTLDSSILIRSLVFGSQRVFLGAGGGIVADSEPIAEWEESNHKARGLARALGFDPREAGESP